MKAFSKIITNVFQYYTWVPIFIVAAVFRAGLRTEHFKTTIIILHSLDVFAPILAYIFLLIGLFPISLPWPTFEYFGFLAFVLLLFMFLTSNNWGVKKGEVVVDLGSGDGRLLAACAKKGAVAIGYELNPVLFWVSKFKTRKYAKKIIIKRQSFWQADFKSADVIFVYSLKKYMKKFEDFIYKKAKKGTRVVVNTNPFPRKLPIKSESGIFLYKV